MYWLCPVASAQVWTTTSPPPWRTRGGSSFAPLPAVSCFQRRKRSQFTPSPPLPSPPSSPLPSPLLPSPLLSSPPLPPDCAVHYTVPAWQIAVPTVVVAVLLGIMLIVGIKLCVVFYVSWATLIVAHFSAALQYAPHHNQWIYVGLLGVPKMAEADCGGGPQHGTTALYLC